MALEALPVGIYVANRDGKIILWSAGAEKLTGYLRQDVLGRLRESELLEEPKPESRAAHTSADDSAETAAPQGAPVVTPLSIHCKNGHCLTVQLRSAPLRDEMGKLLGTVKLFDGNPPSRFVNRRQDKLAAYGCLDPQTGVLNHSLIQARLKESLTLHALYPVPFSVVCYGVDNLRTLGERYGHAAGDAALCMVANCFESGLRPTDFIGRWMEQEFLAILPVCGETDVMAVGERLRRLVEHAGMSWWGDTLHATVSIGATVVHANDSVSTLVGRAEQALRESAESGGNRVVVLNSTGERAM